MSVYLYAGLLFALSISAVSCNKHPVYEHCPPGFYPQDIYCFIVLSPNDRIGAEEDCARVGRAELFAVDSWRDQRAIQAFFRKTKLTTYFWLDGHYLTSGYRSSVRKLMWTNRFFPWMTNFKHSHAWRGDGQCIVMDPQEDYHWFPHPCTDANVLTVCVKARYHQLTNYDLSKEKQENPKPDFTIL